MYFKTENGIVGRIVLYITTKFTDPPFHHVCFYNLSFDLSFELEFVLQNNLVKTNGGEKKMIQLFMHTTFKLIELESCSGFWAAAPVEDKVL